MVSGKETKNRPIAEESTGLRVRGHAEQRCPGLLSDRQGASPLTSCDAGIHCVPVSLGMAMGDNPLRWGRGGQCTV